MPQAPDPLDALLDLDEAYDRAPHGPPPIRTHQYRAALRAALALQPTLAPAELSAPGRDDYEGGQLDLLRIVRRDIARALDAERAARPDTAEIV